MARGPVPAILARQNEDGGWAPVYRFYTSKYRGTAWNLIILAELGADPTDDRVRRACDHILRHSWSGASGGFATRPVKTGGGDEARVIPCLTGNMVASLIRLGRLGDERVRRGIAWIAKYMRADDGDSGPPRDFRYRHETACYGRHTCFHGVVKGLKALAEVPDRLRTAGVKRAVRLGAEFMLRHRVYRSSHDPGRIAHSGWAAFGFPNMWNTDALEILGILSRLGFRDERMRGAVELVRRKQDERGRWVLGQSWNGKMLVDIEQKGRPSKWITLNAIRALGAGRE